MAQRAKPKKIADLNASMGDIVVQSKRLGKTNPEIIEITGLTVGQLAKIIKMRKADIYRLDEREQALVKAGDGAVKKQVNTAIETVLNKAVPLMERAAGPDGKFEQIAPRDALMASIKISDVAVNVRRIEEPPPPVTNINVTTEEAHIIGQEVRQLFLKGAEGAGDDVDDRDGVEITLSPEVEFMVDSVEIEEDE